MRFLVDAQLPPRLARGIALCGHQAEHVADVDLRQASDGTIWQFALDYDAIVVTKDEDFALRASVARRAPRIVWLRLGNVRNAALDSCMARNWPEIEAALEAGERLVEIR